MVIYIPVGSFRIIPPRVIIPVESMVPWGMGPSSLSQVPSMPTGMDWPQLGRESRCLQEQVRSEFGEPSAPSTVVSRQLSSLWDGVCSTSIVLSANGFQKRATWLTFWVRFQKIGSVQEMVGKIGCFRVKNAVLPKGNLIPLVTPIPFSFIPLLVL